MQNTVGDTLSTATMCPATFQGNSPLLKAINAKLDTTFSSSGNWFIMTYTWLAVCETRAFLPLYISRKKQYNCSNEMT
jgi:hypothetical protein